jgi:hypothetical protein
MPLPTPSGFTVYLQSGGSNGMTLRWNDRGLNSSVPLTFDASQFLADAGNDSIIASSVTISFSPVNPTNPAPASPLTIGPVQATGTALTWQMTGGVLTNPVADYIFTIGFTTVGGIVWEENVWQRIWPLSPNNTYATDLIVIEGPQGPPGDSLTGAFEIDQSGNATLTTESGSPIVLTGFVQAVFAGLPTSPAGLGSGQFYLNQGVPQKIP